MSIHRSSTSTFDNFLAEYQSMVEMNAALLERVTVLEKALEQMVWAFEYAESSPTSDVAMQQAKDALDA